MKKFALLLLLLLVGIPGLCHASGNDKYQKLFYPKGMPVKEGNLGTGQTIYHYYGEAEIPKKNLIVVLYSENLKGNYPYESDYECTAYLAILHKTVDSSPTITSITDVTKYITTQMDECKGCFSSLDGQLDIILLKDDIDLVHLSIGAYLAGHFEESSLSDVFFRCDDVKKN